VRSKGVLVAIPAWNEEGSIADVIAKVREHRPDADILVVNDGSTDATPLRARASATQEPTPPMPTTATCDCRMFMAPCKPYSRCKPPNRRSSMDA
jgi:glycosyltransferase involved in cell wall biosynthesis